MAESYRFTVSASAPANPERRRAALWPEKRPVPEWWVNGGLGEESWRDGRAERQTRGHEDRMKTASALLDMALDSDRCRFGPRRLSLSGTFTADSADQAVVALLDLLRWTLKSVYGANQDYRGRVQPSGVRIDLRAISTR